tara:strand:+ start:1212 stop:1952 length:741 start_codon:yes stop_codon:yes gene_type:complete
MSRRKRKDRQFKAAIRQLQTEELILKLDTRYLNKTANVTVIPKNITQDTLVESLEHTDTNITFAVGPAGTGKTYIATKKAIQALTSGAVSKIIVTRPAVSVDEQHGFLPGTLQEKMAPWTRPIIDIFEEHFTPSHIENMIEANIIEIAPLAYMRGRTFKNAFIIADEMQNATQEQMKMLLTRIGPNSKLVVTGDLNQHDRGFGDNGLKDFLVRIEGKQSRYIKTIYFDTRDIERHPAVAEVLSFYD